MVGNQMSLQKLAKEVYIRAKQMQQDGAVPTFLGVDGLLALMHDSIRRHHTDVETDHKFMWDLAVFSLFALGTAVEQDEWEDLVDEPVEEETPPDLYNYPVEEDEIIEEDPTEHDPNLIALPPGKSLEEVVQEHSMGVDVADGEEAHAEESPES